tara:strand:+ start:301 stop:609 length:309 start_codon:yes stop_codon:yes gene_type:complete
MIRFIEVLNETNFNPRMERTSTPRFTLGEVWINEKYVVSIREALGYTALLQEGLLPEGLENAHSFTLVSTQNGNVQESHVVVGAPHVVAGRLGNTTKQLLKG